MVKLLKYDKFFETNLNLPELDKSRGGQIRGQILVNKLKKGDTLTTNDNDDIKIQSLKVGDDWKDIESGVEEFTTDGEYDSEKAKKYFKKGQRYRPVFQDHEESEWKLDQLKKTKDFGSSGAGTRVRQFESIQAIFLAIKQAHPEVKLEPENAVDFFKSYIRNIRNGGKNLVYLPDSVKLTEDLIEQFIKEKDWIDTFCRIPNEIWEQDYHIDKNNLYAIYQLGYSKPSPISILKSQYKKFSQLEGFKDIDFSKWSPADVYLVKYINIEEVMSKISSTENLSSLTQICDDLFDSGIMIPLSLKKVTKGKVINIITNKEREKNLPIFRITGLSIGSDMKGIGSKVFTKSHWRYREDKFREEQAKRDLSLDSSDSSRKQNIDGEVEGSASRHGKVSWNAIKRFIESHRPNYPNMTPLIDASELKNSSIEELELLAKSLIEEIRTQNTSKIVKVKPIARGSDITGNEGKLISRIQSLQIIQALNEVYRHNRRDANEIMTKIMRYALSIQTDKFDTPRYLRVI
jgi:hypothetical protein